MVQSYRFGAGQVMSATPEYDPVDRRPTDDGTVTALLHRVAQGDESARETLANCLYDVLHRLAKRHMRGQPTDHTLQATALVGEVWLRIGSEQRGWASRSHYLTVASTAMRQILIDHARARSCQKRRISGRRVPLDDLVDAFEQQVGELTVLHDALEKMRSFAPEMARAVELRLFGGAEVEDCAKVLGMSKRTFERRWTAISAWLRAELREA